MADSVTPLASQGSPFNPFSGPHDDRPHDGSGPKYPVKNYIFFHRLVTFNYFYVSYS